jgi:hypothetical protein
VPVSLWVWALVASAEQPPIQGSAGLGVGPVAVRQAARHVMAPSLGAWGTGRWPPGLVLGGELGLWRRRVESSLYEHERSVLSAAALAGWGVSTRQLAVDWAVGPTGSLELGRVEEHRFVQPGAGLRLRSAFEVRFIGAVVARAALGASVWGAARWDFDASGGLGVAW